MSASRLGTTTRIAASFSTRRHTQASQLIAGRMDVVTVSRRLGHGSPAITLKTYSHLFGSSDQAAARLVDAASARSQVE
jgi:integrase